MFPPPMTSMSPAASLSDFTPDALGISTSSVPSICISFSFPSASVYLSFAVSMVLPSSTAEASSLIAPEPAPPLIVVFTFVPGDHSEEERGLMPPTGVASEASASPFARMGAFSA